MKEPDSNDLMREGALPEPFKGPPFPSGEAQPEEDGGKLDGHWRTADRAWLEAPPPPRSWLLTRKGSEGETEGVFPAGKVGMLAAEGGCGKTTILVQLALAVALPSEAHRASNGRYRWLGCYDIARPGKVLLLLGEEDGEEVRRRLYNVARGWGLTGPADSFRGAQDAVRWRTEALGRLVVVPGAGVAGMTLPNEGEGGASKFAAELISRLQADGPWSLIILDPASRFLGKDGEKDNKAATEFIQVLEQLSQVPGEPSVLVAHHTSQAARNTGSVDATATRGVTALTDGIRWAANMAPRPDMRAHGTEVPSLVTFKVSKSNYAAKPPTVSLAWSGGTLRQATPEELANYAAAALAAAEEQGEQDGAVKAAKKRGARRGESDTGATPTTAPPTY